MTARSLLVCLCALSVFACTRRTEETKEETIRIVVEREKQDGPEPGAAVTTLPAPATNATAPSPAAAPAVGEPLAADGSPAPDEKLEGKIREILANSLEARSIIARMLESDPNLRDAIRQGDLIPLIAYLREKHQPALRRLTEILPVSDEKKMAFYLARNLIRKQHAPRGDRPAARR